MKKIARILLSAILAISLTGCNKIISGTQGTTWTCNTCNKADNTGNFCGGCGEAKSDNSGWTCKTCNTTGNTGKFCSNCGSSKDSQAGITSNKPVESSSREESSSLDSTSVAESSSTESYSKPESSRTESSSKPESSSSKPETRPSGIVGTLENPANMNEWIACYNYNAVAKDDQEMYIKIKRVIRGTEAQKILDAYNADREYGKLECELADNTELCAVYFDIRYPETWTENPEYGIHLNTPSIGICDLDGLGSVKYHNSVLFTYLRDISESDTKVKIHPGDTVQDCVALFAMYENFDEYLFKIGPYKSEVYVRGA